VNNTVAATKKKPSHITARSNLDLLSGWLVVMHANFHYFALSLSSPDADTMRCNWHMEAKGYTGRLYHKQSLRLDLNSTPATGDAGSDARGFRFRQSSGALTSSRRIPVSSQLLLVLQKKTRLRSVPTTLRHCNWPLHRFNAQQSWNFITIQSASLVYGRKRVD